MARRDVPYRVQEGPYSVSQRGPAPGAERRVNEQIAGREYHEGSGRLAREWMATRTSWESAPGRQVSSRPSGWNEWWRRLGLRLEMTLYFFCGSAVISAAAWAFWTLGGLAAAAAIVAAISLALGWASVE